MKSIHFIISYSSYSDAIEAFKKLRFNDKSITLYDDVSKV